MYKTHLTYEERVIIQKLLKLNASCCEIAKQLNRGTNTIVVEVCKNGGRLEYNAEKAQVQAQYNMILANEKRSAHNINQEWNPYKALESRIVSLEMIIEILTQQIEEINGRINNKL